MMHIHSDQLSLSFSRESMINRVGLQLRLHGRVQGHLKLTCVRLDDRMLLASKSGLDDARTRHLQITIVQRRDH